MDPLFEEIAGYIDREGLMRKNDRVLLSMSAGKDSIFLFHALCAIGERAGFSAGIFHLNHMARGDEADLDESHLYRLALEHGVEFHAERASVGTGPSFEERARALRYRLLEDTARRHGFTAVATAHHRDDNIETILMRVLSGTGIHGLRGIPPRRGIIVRPLLDVSSDAIRVYLEKNNIHWREDATNLDQVYTRNFIRHAVIPMVRERFPMAADALAALSATARETALLLDDLVDRCYPDIAQCSGDETWIDVPRLMESRPLFNHVLAHALRGRHGMRVTRSMLDEIYRSYRGGKPRAELYRDATTRLTAVTRDGRRGILVAPRGALPGSSPQWEYRLETGESGRVCAEIPEAGMTIAVERVDRVFFDAHRKNSRYAFIGLDETPGTLYIRGRRSGDRILTDCGSKKIKDLLIELKLDEAAKSRVPILVLNGTVAAFLPGFEHDVCNRISRDFLVDKKSVNVLAVYRLSGSKFQGTG